MPALIIHDFWAFFSTSTISTLYFNAPLFISLIKTSVLVSQVPYFLQMYQQNTRTIVHLSTLSSSHDKNLIYFVFFIEIYQIRPENFEEIIVISSIKTVIPPDKQHEWVKTSKNIKKQRTGHFHRSQNCAKRNFFEKHDSPERFSVKKVRTFMFFSPLWKWRFSVFLSKSWNPQIIAPFHSIKTSLFSVFRWLFHFL